MTGKHLVGGEKGRNNNDSKPRTSRMPHMVARLPITDLNQHLTCALCSGYMIDATTVVECLHSFCRSCLLRYLETSNTCPICDTQINTAQLDKCVRADHTLQDLVYKLVPGLYKSELRRRKDFYLEQLKAVGDDLPSSSSSSVKSDAMVNGGMQIFDKHLVELSAFICTPDEIISFSLESAPRKIQQNDPQTKCNVQNQQAATTAESGLAQAQKAKDTIDKETEDVRFKRYFRCPAAVTVGHLKKLLACKMDLSSSHQIEILHSDEPLLDEYTLMDIAYIYTWRRKAPMQLFFNICKYESEEEPMPLLVPEVAIPPMTPSTSAPPTTTTTVAPATGSSQDLKEDITTPSPATQPRLQDCSGIGGGKKWSTTKKDSSAGVGRPKNSSSNANNLPSDRGNLNAIGQILKLACRPATPMETSMRGKPPVPIHRSPNTDCPANQRMPNGKLPPIRLALTNHRKRKEKTTEEETMPKQYKPRKPKGTNMVSSAAPNVLAALQKLTNRTLMPVAAITSECSIHKPTLPSSSLSPPPPPLVAVPTIAVDTCGAPTAVVNSESSTSPLGAYKPTPAQSACTQPAKLRLKKSLSSVVQELSSNALEGGSPGKKAKVHNGTTIEEECAPLIH